MDFKHYIMTRFNLGLYNSDKFDHEMWMNHRMKLFINITIPSMVAQTCQNFTWLILMDPKTPQKYRDLLAALKYKNMKVIYIDALWTEREKTAEQVLKHLEPGDYDLITTRMDNDDALALDMIEKIQYWYAPKPEPWAISFIFGATLNLKTKKIFPIQYDSNHFPTLIENSSTAKTVLFYPHHAIEVNAKEIIFGGFYWLQVVHSNNLDNGKREKPSIIIMKDNEFKPVILKKFGLDPEKIMTMNFDEPANSNTVTA